MYVVVEGSLGVRREAWQQLLDDVLVLNLLMALKLAELLVEVAQEGVQLQ